MGITETLVKTITKGIQEKKGQDITIIDLKHIDGAIAKYSSFVKAIHRLRLRLLQAQSVIWCARN